MDAESRVRSWKVSPSTELLERIVADWEWLVCKLARKFSRRMPFEDMAQIGRIEIVQALRRFDVTASVTFRTFLTTAASGKMRQYLRDRAELIRLPAWTQEAGREWAGAHITGFEDLAAECEPASEASENEVVDRILVDQIFDSLPAPTRVAVQRFYLAGDCQADIAKDLGISTNYVSTLIQRGLRAMERALG